MTGGIAVFEAVRRGLNPTRGNPASIAQWIERWFSKPNVACPTPVGGSRSHGGKTSVSRTLRKNGLSQHNNARNPPCDMTRPSSSTAEQGYFKPWVVGSNPTGAPLQSPGCGKVGETPTGCQNFCSGGQVHKLKRSRGTRVKHHHPSRRKPWQSQRHGN